MHAFVISQPRTTRSEIRRPSCRSGLQQNVKVQILSAESPFKKTPADQRTTFSDNHARKWTRREPHISRDRIRQLRKQRVSGLARGSAQEHRM
jgi:hypothetical protein